MSPAPRCEIDGEPATASQLAALARMPHGHFTSLQVRDGGVRGLDLHLARLDSANRELYGTPIDAAHVRALLRHALRDRADAGVRIVLHAVGWTLQHMPWPARTCVAVHVSDPTQPATRPLRLRSVEHRRFLPHIKHVATFDLLEQRRRAQAAGFDDALFVDAEGVIAEGTTWNVGAWDGRRVLWPEAPQLHGTAMRLLARAVQSAGIDVEWRVLRAADLAGEHVFACNATTWLQPIVAIDGLPLATDAAAFEPLRALHDALPFEQV